MRAERTSALSDSSSRWWSSEFCSGSQQLRTDGFEDQDDHQRGGRHLAAEVLKSALLTNAADSCEQHSDSPGSPDRRMTVPSGPASATSPSAWRARATISNSPGTTSAGGVRRSTRPGSSTRPRAPRAPDGSARRGTRRSGRRGRRCGAWPDWSGPEDGARSDLPVGWGSRRSTVGGSAHRDRHNVSPRTGLHTWDTCFVRISVRREQLREPDTASSEEQKRREGILVLAAMPQWAWRLVIPASARYLRESDRLAIQLAETVHTVARVGRAVHSGIC